MAAIQAEVLGIFINTCHMLVPRSEAAYGNLPKKKKNLNRERQRRDARGSSEKYFKLKFCEWRNESADTSRTLTW